MPCQLILDCLNEIFKYLEEDKITLRSCLLVNHLWCQVTVRILWMNVWRFEDTSQYRTHVASAILSILIACLPSESKDLLYTNGICILAPTSKPPLFNYALFCKVLPIHKIEQMIECVLYDLEIKQLINSQNLHYKKYLVSQELLKMYMKQISSLKSLDYSKISSEFPKFTYFPGAKDCLKDLSAISCNSNMFSEFFYQLSQLCHNIQIFTISFEGYTSDGLANLISLQNNLKELNLYAYNGGDWTSIIPALSKHYDTLTRLYLFNNRNKLPLSFIVLFSNLQEIKFSFIDGNGFEDFKELQNIIFPKLKILTILYFCPNTEYVVKFLENNGKNLKELIIDVADDLLKSSIAQFCPNLKKLLMTLTKNDEIDILKTIFISCQYIESIQIWYYRGNLNEIEMLKVVAKYSPKGFYELKLLNMHRSGLPKDLESFFINWKDRPSKKSLSLIILKDSNDDLGVDEENMKVIKKYKELGIVRKFETEEI